MGNTWYQVAITADLAARTYTVRIAQEGTAPQTLISGASFRTSGGTSGGLSHVALWASNSARIELADIAWTAGTCEPQTCGTLGHACGAPDDGCGTSLDCGSCPNGQFCSADGVCGTQSGPQQCSKPTASTTGPRVPLSHAAGGELSGTHMGKRFGSQVIANGPLTLIDCEMPGLRVNSGPVVVDHSVINGWLGVVSNNADPNLELLTMTNSRSVGPRDNDAIRIGSSVYASNTEYMNTRIENSILHSPYDSQNPSSHFDLLQFGGGINSEFSCVVFSYEAPIQGAGPTSYINNGVGNRNVVLEDIWFEGREVSWAVGGAMSINRCTMERSTRLHFYVYPNGDTPTLTNCFDDAGTPIE